MYQIRLFFLAGTLLFVSQKAQCQSPASIIREMIKSASELKGFTAEITKEERIDGEMVKQITDVKLLRNPFQLYLYQQFPKKGVEVLVRKDNDKPLINPNAFPWFNLNLDPYGSLMRKNQHHTVYDSGFDLMVNILEKELIKIGADSAKYIFNSGIVEWEKRPAYQIEFINTDFGYSLYRVQMGENLTTIARKLNISEYAILDLNKDIDFYDDVTPGQEIKVPTSYAKKMILYIDKGYMLPLVIKVYDEKGFYEHYSYKKFVLNPLFKEGEFQEDYPDYGF